MAALDRLLQQVIDERGFEHSSAEPADPPETPAMLGLDLPSIDEHRDVLVHLFGAANNNEAIGALVRGFVNQLIEQRHRLVESAKSAGLCDPELDTAAVSLLCEAVGIGLRLLLSAGLDGRLVPSTEAWNTLLVRLSAAEVAARADPLPAP